MEIKYNGKKRTHVDTEQLNIIWLNRCFNCSGEQSHNVWIKVVLSVVFNVF